MTDKKQPVKVIGLLDDKKGVKINFPQLVAKNSGFNIKKFRNSMSTKQTVNEKSQAALKKRKVYFGVAKTLRAFIASDNDLYITRIAAGELYDKDLIDGLQCNIIQGVNLPADKCEFECELFDYQIEMIEKITALDDTWSPHKSLTYVCMPTGSGKTIVGCGLIAERKKSTFIVVPTKEIAGQWIDDIRRTLPKLRVCMVEKKLIDNDELKKYDVAVCVINTARKLEHTIVKYFGQILIDEVHEAYTKVNSGVLWLAQCFQFGVGFSATPSDREDGLDQHVFKFLGNPIQCVMEMPKYKFQVNIVEFYGDNEFCQPVVSNGVLIATSTIEKLAKEPARIELVCSLAKQLIEEGEDIFIFAEHRELLTIFRDKLVATFKDNIEIPELGILRGGVKGAEAKEARAAKIVLTTFGYSRRGVSIKDKTAIIFATPRRTPLAQIFGRVTRRGGPGVDKVRKVYFIADMKSPIKGQVDSIKTFAKERGYEITKRKVKPTVKNSEPK
jgi:hypothetical protein